MSNGKVIVRLNITSHLIVEIKCNTGYNIEGNQLIHCINGKWESPNVTCKGTHVILKQCMHTYVCMYVCICMYACIYVCMYVTYIHATFHVAGLTLYMNFYYIIAITCPVPKDIPSGSVTTTGLTYGHFAEYKCKDG